MRLPEICLMASLLAAVSVARAEVVEFTDPDAWAAAAGPFTTIDFTGFPEGTPITDQYADLGVVFTGGLEHIDLSSAFLNDGVGLVSAFADIQAEFAAPQFWIAVDFPGELQFELYSGGQLIYTSSAFDDIMGHFAGLVSTEPFDRANIFDPTDDVVAIDDLHFGPPIPGSPAFALLGLAGLISRRRRDRRHART
jgi:MYXO-CTERM domain-containing protein